MCLTFLTMSYLTSRQTPEFFYHTEFLLNTNAFDFGSRQNGERVGNVQLPPWARTVEEFVTLNRAALESEYVSRNLHVRALMSSQQRARSFTCIVAELDRLDLWIQATRPGGSSGAQRVLLPHL